MAAELGPFYMDLKNVPKHFSAERVLKCVQIYEEGSSVEDVTSFDTAKATEREDVYVRRIHEIYSHGYECEPDTKVLRTVWSSRTEPAALASTSRIELDGALLSLCRFGNDVCDRCFSTQHRTSGCARATRRAEEQHVKHVTAKHARRQQRRRAARALRLKSLAVSRQATPPEQQQHDGMGPAGAGAGAAAEVAASAAAAKLLRASVKVKNFVEEPLVIPPLPPNNDRVGVPMRSTLRPVLFDRRPEAAGALERDSLNGRFNTQSVVDRLSDAYLSAEQRGRVRRRKRR